MIEGMEKKKEGMILLGDEDEQKKRVKESNVGFVLKNYEMLRNMKVEDNIGLGLKVRKGGKRK